MVDTGVAMEKVSGVHPLDMVSTEQVGDVLSRSEIDEAFREAQALKANRMQFIALSFEMAVRLKRIRDNRWYKVLGYESFELWVESPEVDIDRSSAYRYIKLYEGFVLSGAYTIEELLDKSISKMEILLPLVDVEARDWVKRKEKITGYMDLTRRDLIAKLNGESNAPSLPRTAGLADSVEAARAIDANYEDVTGKRNDKAGQKGASADRDVREALSGSSDESDVEVSQPVERKLGLSGWYELVPVVDDEPRGKSVRGTMLDASSLVVSGNRIFANLR